MGAQHNYEFTKIGTRDPLVLDAFELLLLLIRLIMLALALSLRALVLGLVLGLVLLVLGLLLLGLLLGLLRQVAAGRLSRRRLLVCCRVQP